MTVVCPLATPHRDSRPPPATITSPDFNAKVGDDQYFSWPEVVGWFGLGRAIDRGQQLLQCCAIDDLEVANTVFQHVNTRIAMWISPDGGTMNQIDYILVQRKLKGQLKNCRTYISAELCSDHFLVIANIYIKPCVSRSHRKVVKRYDVDKLCDRETRQEFRVKIGEAFEHLLEIGDKSVEELWLDFKETANEIIEKVVGFRRRTQVISLPSVLARECEERRKARTEYLKNTSNAKSYGGGFQEK